MTRRITVMLPLILLWAVMFPDVAAADPPAATNYLTTVVSVEPAAPEIDVSIVGGDSFVLLRADPGTSVEVIGYRGEPFVRFLASGQVEVDEASVTYLASRSRYGSDFSVDSANARAADWHTVATDGTYAWHDHRTHWMNTFAPPGRQPGDVVLEATVPLIINGRSTTITVQSVWAPPPSPVAAWCGFGIGLVGVAVIVATRRRPATTIVITGTVSLLALALGWWQFRSVPAETGPPWTMVGLPVVAIIGVVVAGQTVARSWAARWSLPAIGGMLLAGIELGLWAWLRRTNINRAILPTNAPWWFDRADTTATLVVAAAVLGVTVTALLDAELRLVHNLAQPGRQVVGVDHAVDHGVAAVTVDEQRGGD